MSYTTVRSTFLSNENNTLIQEEDIEEFYEAFNSFKSGEGVDNIEIKHFPQLMRALGQCPTEAEIIQMLREVDVLSSETLTFQEFVDIMMKHFKTPYTDEDLTRAFQVFDKSGDGVLSTKEIMYVIQSLGEVYQEEDVHEMFGEIDKDKDGKLRVDDFIALMGIHGRSRQNTRVSYR